MAHIDIRREHGMSQEKALETADSLARSLASEYDMKYSWRGATLDFHRAGVHGELRVLPNVLEIELKLGLLLRPFRGRIEQEIERQLAQLTDAD